MVPTGDERYQIVDQTWDSSLRYDDADPANISILRQFTQLLPLRPMFQAQASELGALMAIAGAISRGCHRDDNDKDEQECNDFRDSTWVGLNPVKRSLPPSLLDKARLLDDPVRDHDTVFFWTTCCGNGIDMYLSMDLHNYEGDGNDLNKLHLLIARSVFGSCYTKLLPQGQTAWSMKGGFVMHRDLFLQFACFCRVFLAHFLDRYVTVLRNTNNDTEAVRPEIFVRPEQQGDGHSNTRQRAWGYVFERLLNYWVMNSGYGLVMIDGGENSGAEDYQRTAIESGGGRWQLRTHVRDAEDLTDTQKRLRMCQSFLCCSLVHAAPTLVHPSSTTHNIQCPHLYTDSLSSL
jgi:hypothetical protein